MVLAWKTDPMATLKWALTSALDLKGQDMLTWLQGKKTYVVAIGGIVAAIVAYTQGTIDTTALVGAILAGVLAMTIRNGSATDAAKTVVAVENK
jgi:hypothetical protein